MIEAWFVGWLIGMGMFAVIWFVHYRVTSIGGVDLDQSPQRIFEKPRTLVMDFPKGLEPQASDVQYSVTGSPRHIPWSRRRKELEQAARQKRRHLESFTEEA